MYVRKWQNSVDHCNDSATVDFAIRDDIMRAVTVFIGFVLQTNALARIYAINIAY